MIAIFDLYYGGLTIHDSVCCTMSVAVFSQMRAAGYRNYIFGVRVHYCWHCLREPGHVSSPFSSQPHTVLTALRQHFERCLISPCRFIKTQSTACPMPCRCSCWHCLLSLTTYLRIRTNMNMNCGFNVSLSSIAYRFWPLINAMSARFFNQQKLEGNLRWHHNLVSQFQIRSFVETEVCVGRYQTKVTQCAAWAANLRKRKSQTATLMRAIPIPPI